jgi:uncharacterized protein YdhG (YjbR/CyaY superfamily)
MDLVNQEIKLYFNQFSKDIQERLQTIRNIAFELIPNASEAIKYRMPTIMYKQKMSFIMQHLKIILVYILYPILLSSYRMN